ncbi:MAG TPA: extracellular solute-binding protein [Nitrososphaeraceae archaeon]|nr:extracellular solute-binding protein [Nitrososphaeraceae archaeon]
MAKLNLLMTVSFAILSLFFISQMYFIPVIAQEEVTLTAIFAEPKERWDMLLENATKILNDRHPDKTIKIDYRVLPYSDTRTQILTAMAGKTPIDLISLDQIWLGEFAEGGFLSDLTANTEKWNKSSDWYLQNWEGGLYNNQVKGIWAWTDVRALWYWKDLLDKAEINPDELENWNGYLSASKKLNQVLQKDGTQGMHLVGAAHSPDMWYPYLWMLGGEILEKREEHPTKQNYWYPTYNSDLGVKALQFLKDQVDAGIKPQMNHYWGQEFADKKFAGMLEGSWLLGQFDKNEWNTLKEKIGMIPMFPVPNTQNTNTSTLMGGWLLSIPETSQNKELSWELLTIMLEPNVLIPMLLQQGYLPTQKSIGEGKYSEELKSTIPYYEELISLIALGKGRPNIPEYPIVAEHIRNAIEQVYNGMDPKQALDEASKQSAKALGW